MKKHKNTMKPMPIVLCQKERYWAFAAMFPDIIKKEVLPKRVSIHTAEMTAIKQL